MRQCSAQTTVAPWRVFLIILTSLQRASEYLKISISSAKRLATLLGIGLCSLPSIASAVCPATATSDFDGTCTSDILWQNANGDVNVWLIKNGVQSSSTDLGIIPAGWTIQGTGDFNGDGTTDILWRNSNGDVQVWLMSNGLMSSSIDLGVIPNNWTIQGTGDFNHDGTTDILWRNSDGEVSIWLMNGGMMNSSTGLGVVPTNWTIQGTGDFNGDGTTDILWRNSSGDVQIWLISNATQSSSTDLGVVPNSWTIQGTGDFNQDGTSDLLWRNSDGQVGIWLIKHGMMNTSTGLGTVPNSWTIQGTGDFNGNGTTDILWRNASGDVNTWLVSAGMMSSSTDLGVIPASWAIQQYEPYGAPAAAKAVGYSVRTFDSTTLGNTVGQLYAPTNFFQKGIGTAAQNSDGSFTMTNGSDLPIVATAHADTTKPNNWSGECFTGGGYFDTYASWTPFFANGALSVPYAALYDINTTADNAVGSWNQWGTQPITATTAPATGAASLGIPAWAGVNNTTVGGAVSITGTAGQLGGPTISGVSVSGTAGQFAATFSGLFVGDTITIATSAGMTPGGTGSISGYSSPTTYYVSAVNASTQTFTLETMGKAAITTTPGTLTGLTYTPGPSATLSGLFVGETITISGTLGGTGAISGYSSPTTYYVSAVSGQTFTLETMGKAAITTTPGTLTGLTYTPGLSGTVTFSDSETRLASFTPGATSISWIGGLTGASTPAISVNWGPNFGHWPEVDIFEADGASSSLLGNALHDWYAQVGANIKTQTRFGGVTVADTSTPHHYSVLWMPATAGAQGYVNWYVDGTLENTATWNQYNSATPPAPAGTESGHVWTGGNAFGVMDSRCMLFNWGTAANTAAPMTIYSVTVWQASSSDNQTQ